MKDLVVTQETFEFVCRHCHREWVQRFEARRMHSSLGEDLVEYLVDGMPVPAPVADLRCPHCGALAVHVAPLREAITTLHMGPPAAAR
ncbi:MAG: hypothetical protein R2737_03510 [Candidatus Nanopelagicales bacterium]